MKNICLALLCFVALTDAAFADSPNQAVKRACLKDAHQDYRDDISDANADLRLSTATCRFGPVVGACMGNCFQDFKSCLIPVRASLSSCRQTCGSTFEAARKAARDALGCAPNCGTNLAYQTAIIQAGLAFHSCHISCRSTPESIAARASCRTTHSACVKTCKSAE